MPNYLIIGADGKEYGPVTAEQLRQWIGDRRANAHTRARVEGTDAWKLLRELPEFADLVGGPAPGGPASPAGGANIAEPMAAEILARGYQVEIGRCIERGWKLVMDNFWLTVGATVLIFVISLAAGAVPFGSLLLYFVFWGGLDVLFLKLARGQKAEFGDAFCGFSTAFVPLMVFSIVGQILTSLGLFLCIVPGIYLLIAWWLFTPLLILDKRLDFWPAMELSRRVVNRHWWPLFGLFVLCLLITIVGTLCCGLGLFIALPITTAAVVFAYQDIFGSASAIPQMLASLPVPASVNPVPSTPSPSVSASSPPYSSTTTPGPPTAPTPAPGGPEPQL